MKGEEKKRKDKHARMPIYRTLTCSISLKQKKIYIENEESID